MFQLIQNQTADRIVFGRRIDILQSEMGQKIVKRTLSVHQHAAVLAHDDIRLFTIFEQLAHKGFENIFQSHDTLRDAELVANDAITQLLGPQLFQRHIHLRSLMEQLDRGENLPQRESGVPICEKRSFR